MSSLVLGLLKIYIRMKLNHKMLPEVKYKVDTRSRNKERYSEKGEI
jgi:hypothetical protein